MTLTYNESEGVKCGEYTLIPLANIISISKTVNYKTFVIILKNNLAIVNLPEFNIFCKLSCHEFSDEERIFTVIGYQSSMRYFAGLRNAKNKFEFSSAWSVIINPKYWIQLNYQLIVFEKDTFIRIPLIEENG